MSFPKKFRSCVGISKIEQQYAGIYCQDSDNDRSSNQNKNDTVAKIMPKQTFIEQERISSASLSTEIKTNIYVCNFHNL